MHSSKQLGLRTLGDLNKELEETADVHGDVKVATLPNGDIVARADEVGPHIDSYDTEIVRQDIPNEEVRVWK